MASRQRGLTLVELAVTIALAAVLYGIAVPSFSAWQGNSRIRASADTIHAGLRLARAESITRNASVAFTLQTNGDWSVSCTTVTTQCPANIHSRPGAEVRGGLSLVTTQRDNVVATGAATVTFNSLGQPDAVDTSLRRIDITVPSSIVPTSQSRAMRIVLTDFGLTRLCDPGATSGTPTACS
jgi:type IV fimbrial biogenesis protein FimT